MLLQLVNRHMTDIADPRGPATQSPQHHRDLHPLSRVSTPCPADEESVSKCIAIGAVHQDPDLTPTSPAS